MKKKKLIVISAVVLTAAAAAGADIYFLRPGTQKNEMPQMPEGMTLSDQVVSATGLTSTGMLEEIYELDFLTEGLYIEETYLNMGDEVDADTPIFKVSEESLTAARKELEKEVQKTQLTRREGEITYKTGLIEAQEEKSLADIEAAYAQTVYDSTVSSAEEKVNSLQEQVDEASEKVEEYTASIENNYYYTYYKVDEYKATWLDYASFLTQLYSQWNIEALEDTYGGSGGKNGVGYVTNQVNSSGFGDSGSQPMGGMNTSDEEIKYNVYLAMVEETYEQADLYNQAVENYENAKKTAAAGIASVKSELATLQAQLSEEQLSYEKIVIEAQKTYDQALAGKENAQLVYDSTIKQLEEDYEALKDEEETAAENLELFEATVGDGYFYTAENGTVMMTNVRKGSTLTESTMILAYSNPDSVTVSASVAQEDISKVSVGQEAFVAVSGYGSFTGSVTSFSPVSSSMGGANVSYTVNVLLEGDVSGLESNLTAYVYLGLTEEEKKMLDGSGRPDDMPSDMDGGMPEGMEGGPGQSRGNGNRSGGDRQ